MFEMKIEASGWGCSSVEKRVLSIYKALGTTPSTEKTKKQRKKKVRAKQVEKPTAGKSLACS